MLSSERSVIIAFCIVVCSISSKLEQFEPSSSSSLHYKINANIILIWELPSVSHFYAYICIQISAETL